MSKGKWTCPHCPEFKDRTAHIDKFLALGRAHQMKYRNPQFRFCPWCGMKLKPLNEEELPVGAVKTISLETNFAHDNLVETEPAYWVKAEFACVLGQVFRDVYVEDLQPIYWHITIECETKIGIKEDE